MATFPRKNKIDFVIPVFDGGLNTKYTDINLPTNQSPSLQNVEFDDLGSVSTINGNTSAFVSIGSAVVNGLFSWRKNDASILLAACNGVVWKYSAPSWVTVAQTYFKKGFDVDFVQTEDYVIVNNGATDQYKYDGTNFERFGVIQPAEESASAVCSSAGTLTGEYKYALTGINRYNLEGDYSEITSAALTVAAGQITLSEIPLFPSYAGVIDKYLYRNTAGASAVFWRVTALTANQTSCIDNNSDSVLVTEAPEDNGIPPICKIMIEYRGRMFVAGNGTYPYRLFWSKAGEREIFPSTNYTDIGKGDGNPISGMVVYGNSLFIHKNDGGTTGSLWILNMPDSLDVTEDSNWYIERLPINYGSVGQKVIVFFQNMMFYLNRFGAYAVAGKNLLINPAFSEVGQFPVESLSYFIEPDVFGFKYDGLKSAASIAFNNKIYLSVPYKKTSTENDRVYVYDFLRTTGDQVGAWSYMTNPKINNFAIHENELYGGSALEDGIVYKLDSGRSFNGSAIDSFYWTPQLYGLEEHKDNTKVFRYIYLLVECLGNWTIDVYYVVDYRNDSTQGTTESVTIYGNGGIWDGTDNNSKWNYMTWDSEIVKKLVRVTCINAVGKSIKVRIRTNSATQFFKIHNMSVSYNLRSVRE
jgi:hypothetical protein